jgi:isopentenyldiphosphate isomerase
MGMFWITALHIILVLFSAVYMSKEAWLFISGGLFYILFAVYFLFLFLKNMGEQRKLLKEEWFPIVDPEGRIIGKAPRSVCHNGKSMLLHPVVHLHLFNKEGELFLQKRSMKKDIQPGKWDTSVGGHIDLNETVEDALKREAREELAITGFSPVFLGRYIWESSREKELVNSFSTYYDVFPTINRDEIEEGRFWSMDEIKSNIGKGVFTPNFENEFNMIFMILPKTKIRKK